MKVLIVNAGSTSYKYQLYDPDSKEFLINGRVERIGSTRSAFVHDGPDNRQVKKTLEIPNHKAAIELSLQYLLDGQYGLLGSLEELDGVGFKAVHAGEITGPVLINEALIEKMQSYDQLVPIHNPPYIEAMRMFRDALPQIPLVGVFETWFHETMPDYARTYSIPWQWTQEWGIKKYGFHGSSHRYISERVSSYWCQGQSDLKLISCHLGGSSSLCAVQDGKSIDTSMGMSAQCGLPMSSRVGDLDPFVPLYVMSQGRLNLEQVQYQLANQGGLAGISGLSGDMRDLEEAAAEGNYRAALALNVFQYQLKLYLGAYAAALNGLDVIAFTGGIGENSSRLRWEVLSQLSYLGIKLDPERNRLVGQEAVISADDSMVRVLVIPANEAEIVGRETARVIRDRKG